MIDEELFQDFIGNRQDIKKPMTDRAIKMLRKKLDRLESEGHCPAKLLERSIIQGWQDVYPDTSTIKTKQGFIERQTDRSWAEGLDNTTNVKRIR